jgi:23S rRNA (uracil1939-C5)-methyltransferase
VAEPPVLPLVPSAEEWHYRSRVQFKCRQTESGFVMGFYRRGSHFVVDVEECPITAAPLNEVLRLFRQWLPASPCPAQIPQVDLECGDDGRVRAVVHAIGGEGRALGDYLRPLAERYGLALFLQSGRKETLVPVCGEADLQIDIGEPPRQLAYGPGGFAQVNLAQNRAMVREVVAAAALTGRERVLDLFCGMGNFSLPLAVHAGEVLGVEADARAIAKARENARRHRIANAVFHARPADGAASELALGRRWDLAVLDPPRAGAYPVIRELAQVRPARIFYISCDPSTLARDLVPLLYAGYRLCSVRPFDLFPQTGHIETISCLQL